MYKMNDVFRETKTKFAPSQSEVVESVNIFLYFCCCLFLRLSIGNETLTIHVVSILNCFILFHQRSDDRKRFTVNMAVD